MMMASFVSQKIELAIHSVVACIPSIWKSGKFDALPAGWSPGGVEPR